ncbi:MAG: dihydrodipicolinate synthase family protein [Acidobacteriota bacterium]
MRDDGESATMDPGEQEQVIGWAVTESARRAIVLAGAGSNDTRKAIGLAKAAGAAGADGVLVVTPYYNKPTPSGLLAHYLAVADASPVPVVLYNVPGRTGVNMLPETVLKLARHENVAGIKDASGNLDQVSEILRGRPERFAVLSGEDSLTAADRRARR